MRKRRKITTMDTQERYFQNSLGHPSLPTALFFLADPRALIGSISRGIACCSAAFFMPAKKGPVCGRLTSSFLAEAFRPTPVSRGRSTAVSPAGPRSDPCTWHVAAWKACVGNDLRPHGCGKPVAAMACGRWLWKACSCMKAITPARACGCNGLWPLVVESL